MTEPSEEPVPETQVAEEVAVKKLWTEEEIKQTLHPALHEEYEMMWGEIDLVLTDWLGWHYQGECDLSECQTWKCVCECLWKHKGLEFRDDYGILKNLD